MHSSCFYIKRSLGNYSTFCQIFFSFPAVIEIVTVSGDFFRIVHTLSGFLIVKPTFIQGPRILVYLLFSSCIPCYNFPFVLYYSTVTNGFFFNFCACSLYGIVSNFTLIMFLKISTNNVLFTGCACPLFCRVNTSISSTF